MHEAKEAQPSCSETSRNPGIHPHKGQTTEPTLIKWCCQIKKRGRKCRLGKRFLLGRWRVREARGEFAQARQPGVGGVTCSVLLAVQGC